MESANDVLFRAHMCGSIMPAENPRVKFTDTHIKEMIKIFNAQVHHRYDEIKSKYLTKGNEREEDSITLLSRNTKILYRKNEERLFNEYVTAIPDLFEGKSIQEADATTDVKTSWSKGTFDESRVTKLNPIYMWQGVAQMWLTGAKKHTVAYNLVNGTFDNITKEKYYLKNDYGDGYETNPSYIEKCKQIEINNIFDLEEFRKENRGFDFHNDLSDWHYDIHYSKRTHTKSFERNEADILRLAQRIKECRIYMNENLF